MLAVCEEFDLASLNRGPLAMGLLTAKYQDAPAARGGDDVRGAAPRVADAGSPAGGRAPSGPTGWPAVREALTADGRTLAQGALGWLLRPQPADPADPRLPDVGQAEENLGALAYGPLPQAAFAEVERLLADLRTASAAA